MPYVTLDQMKAVLPAEICAQLLDDLGSGVPSGNVWSQVIAQVQAEIDGKLAMRYPLPLDPVPLVIHNAAVVLAAELLYQRKNFHGEKNPWFARANSIRGTLGQPGGQAGLLDRLASGEITLTAEAKPAKPAGSVITEPAKTTSATGRLLC
jgi:phage gp36-like protein